MVNRVENPIDQKNTNVNQIVKLRFSRLDNFNIFGLYHGFMVCHAYLSGLFSAAFAAMGYGLIYVRVEGLLGRTGQSKKAADAADLAVQTDKSNYKSRSF